MKKATICCCMVICMILLVACESGSGEKEHEHTYSEATCTEPAKCTICGAIQGSALGHEYTAATCTEASKCIRCGIASGSALGHSTDVGECSRCGEFQGTQIVQSIIININAGNIFTSSGNNIIYNTDWNNVSTAAEFCDALNAGIDKYWLAVENYQSAYDLCGNYSYLSNLKNELSTVILGCPPTYSSTNRADLELWLTETLSFMYYAATMNAEAIVVAGDAGLTVTGLE